LQNNQQALRNSSSNILVDLFADFVGAIEFFAGSEPSIKRLIFVLQLSFGALFTYRLVSQFRLVGIGAWYGAIGAFIVGTVLFGSILAFVLKWLAMISIKLVAGVYIVTWAKTLLLEGRQHLSGVGAGRLVGE